MNSKTKIMAEIHWLNWFMIVICAVIFVGVFGVMFYSILKHRKSKGAKAASFHESTTVEIIWTVIPLIIVIAMALPATKTVVAMKDTTNADLTVKVTGMQWKWGYDYIKGEGEGIGFVATIDAAQREMSNNGGPKKGEDVDDYLLKVDNPLVIPVDKKIIDGYLIAQLELQQKVLPFIIRRPLPGGKSEYWRLADLELI